MYQRQGFPDFISKIEQRIIERHKIDRDFPVLDAEGMARAWGLAAADPLIPCNEGGDISHWQPAAKNDYTILKESGVEFIFFKVSQSTWIDDQAEAHLRALTDHKIMNGGYHFFKPSVSALAQAQTFSRWLLDNPDWNLPPVLDLEVTDGITGAPLVGMVNDFLHEVWQRTTLKPLIYTSRGFWNANMLVAGRAPSWAKDYEFCLAAWPYTPVCAIMPKMPVGVELGQLVFWQYTGSGRNPGIGSGKVNFDQNWFVFKDMSLTAYAANRGKGYDPGDPESPPPTDGTANLLAQVRERIALIQDYGAQIKTLADQVEIETGKLIEKIEQHGT